MPGSVDRPPNIVNDLRAMTARIAELERQARAIPVIARVFRGTLSVNNSTITQVTFTDVDIDTAGAFDAETPDVLTFPRAGVYLAVGAAVFSDSSSTGDRQAYIEASGVSSFGMTMRAPAGASAQLNPVVFVDAAAADTVQLNVWQSSGGALNLTFAALAIAWLGVGVS